jgi:hypothetical protein
MKKYELRMRLVQEGHLPMPFSQRQPTPSKRGCQILRRLHHPIIHQSLSLHCLVNHVFSPTDSSLKLGCIHLQLLLDLSAVLATPHKELEIICESDAAQSVEIICERATLHKVWKSFVRSAACQLGAGTMAESMAQRALLPFHSVWQLVLEPSSHYIVPV